jgi:lipopolysaccharide export system permease protein
VKKIYWLIIKSYLGPLVMTFFIALFILLMQFLWKYIDDLVGKGLEWYIIAELLFYASSTFVPLALPLAILLSSLMTFGNLGENYELVAMKAAGISLRRVMMPLMIMSILISLIAFYFSNNVLPVANLKFKSLLYDVRQQKLALDIKEGIFYNDIEGFVIRVGEKEKDEKTIRNVLIYDHREKKGNVNVTLADSGVMELAPNGRSLRFILYDGYNYAERTDQRNYRENIPFQRTKFKENFKNFNLVDFEMTRTNEDLFKSNYSMLNLTQLKVAEDSLITGLNTRKNEFPMQLFRSFTFYSSIDSAAQAEYEPKKPYTTNLIEDYNREDAAEVVEDALQRTRRLRESIGYFTSEVKSRSEMIYKHQAEWHRKFTLSVACFVLFFVGAPLGAIIRKGGLGMPVVVSVLFFVLFHIISITGEKSVKSGLMDANVGMWLAPVILFPLGLFLTFKATTDSPLLDAEAWVNFIKKVFKKTRRDESTVSL